MHLVDELVPLIPGLRVKDGLKAKFALMASPVDIPATPFPMGTLATASLEMPANMHFPSCNSELSGHDNPLPVISS